MEHINECICTCVSGRIINYTYTIHCTNVEEFAKYVGIPNTITKYKSVFYAFNALPNGVVSTKIKPYEIVPISKNTNVPTYGCDPVVHKNGSYYYTHLINISYDQLLLFLRDFSYPDINIRKKDIYHVSIITNEEGKIIGSQYYL